MTASRNSRPSRESNQTARSAGHVKSHTKYANDLVARSGMTSMSSNTKEVRFRAREFVDYTATAENPVLHHSFAQVQESLGTAGTGNSLTSTIRLNRVKVWALPRSVNAGNASSSYVAVYGTPVAGSDETAARMLSQRNTLVNPTFNVAWRLIGSTNFDQIVRDSQYAPLAAATTPPSFILFELMLMDPDAGGSVITDSVQLCIETEYTETLPITTTVNSGTSYVASFLSASGPTLSRTFAMMEMMGISSVN